VRILAVEHANPQAVIGGRLTSPDSFWQAFWQAGWWAWSQSDENFPSFAAKSTLCACVSGHCRL